jgi:hypothetical protein
MFKLAYSTAELFDFRDSCTTSLALGKALIFTSEWIRCQALALTLMQLIYRFIERRLTSFAALINR